MTGLEGTELWERIRAELQNCGIDLDTMAGAKIDASGAKVVCLPMGLGTSLEELGKGTRNQVLMVRVDEETSAKLDAWVQTGAVKSRSEAAALFIREGLKVRAQELDQLDEALQGVEEARERLREKAQEVFGGDDDAA